MHYIAIMATESGLFFYEEGGKLCVPMLGRGVHWNSDLEDLHGRWCASRYAPYGVCYIRMWDDLLNPRYPYENAQFPEKTLIKVPNNVAALVIRGSDKELADCIRTFQAGHKDIIDFEIPDAELTLAEKETLDNFLKSVVPSNT